MTNAVDAAIKAAQEKAAAAQAAAPATGTAVATAPAAPGAVAGYQQPRKYTAEDMAAGAMAVDAYLKVTADGLKIGDSAELIAKPIVVAINLDEVGYCEAIKFGDPAQYFKTYDGVKCYSGGTWGEAIAKAQMADPKARPYNSADIPMILLQDAAGIKGTIVGKRGTKLGHSTSTTNRANWVDLVAKAKAAGLKEVMVQVESEAKAKNTYTWGILKFTLLGPVPAEVAVAEEAKPAAATAAA